MEAGACAWGVCFGVGVAEKLAQTVTGKRNNRERIGGDEVDD